MLQAIVDFAGSTGFFQVTWLQVVMWAVILVLFYLAIFKEFEPLLLVPIAFGALIANVPTLGVLNDPLTHADGTFEPGVYIPAYVRRYPFVFMTTPDDERSVLGLDMAASCVSTGETGEALFENGQDRKSVV